MPSSDFFPSRWWLVALAVAMAATRMHHEGTPLALPDASLAVFFLLGRHDRSLGIFTAFLLLAGVLDYAAIKFAGVSDYCVSPAYGFLIPSYAVLWGAGRWSLRASLPRYAGALLAAVTVAFLISNGSFFLFSGKLGETGWLDYWSGLAGYYSDYIGAAFAYVGLAMVMEYLIQPALPLHRSRPDLEA